MSKVCPKMSPADTTQCMKKKKTKLSQRCVNSPFYLSLEEGFKEFRSSMRAAEGDPRMKGAWSGGDDEEDFPEEFSENLPPEGRDPASKRPQERRPRGALRDEL
jgi:hypothetical protein